MARLRDRDFLALIVFLLILNAADAAFTWLSVRAGLAEEANPLLRGLVEDHPAGFVFVKTVLVLLATWLLWRRRHRPLAVAGILAGFVLYYAVVIEHVMAYSRLLLGPVP